MGVDDVVWARNVADGLAAIDANTFTPACLDLRLGGGTSMPLAQRLAARACLRLPHGLPGPRHSRRVQGRPIVAKPFTPRSSAAAVGLIVRRAWRTAVAVRAYARMAACAACSLVLAHLCRADKPRSACMRGTDPHQRKSRACRTNLRRRLKPATGSITRTSRSASRSPSGTRWSPRRRSSPSAAPSIPSPCTPTRRPPRRRPSAACAPRAGIPAQ